ncbi:class I SAM-dependent methyltransferase [Microvirga guangxiensis]|uniref:Methyltransferase domain-containing protein n=1 Tax=Microvirga guangxiensis TaxID=549386 RepID=A0A1G5HTT6_9HYPH|nr:class I SAM-dependent methyltransferase [Microvirga guangxiensis]SCY67183.1 Methyltransferase domain-containing protein [Microvirga guangxiensis]
MSLYSRYIGPKLVSCLCSMDDISAERERVIPLARGVVLEIGMGPGLNLPFYNPADVTKVIGVDPNDAFLHLGEARQRSSHVQVEIVRAPAEALPLGDETIDTAVITYTLCSVEDPEQALREVRRVLKPGGRVLFLEHGLSPEEDVARWQHRLNPIWRSLAVGCNLTRPVAELLRQNGFSIQEMEEYYLGGAPRVIGFHCRGVAQAG